MSRELLLSRFNTTIGFWIGELERLTYEQLVQTPAGMWSYGQLYMHIVGDSEWYLEQIREAMASPAHAHRSMTREGTQMFDLNEFPDERIVNPANDGMPQPSDKEELMRRLIGFRSDMNATFTGFDARLYPGKSKHPGLGYFSALEWLQFADMHMRHHERQMSRIGRALARV